MHAEAKRLRRARRRDGADRIVRLEAGRIVDERIMARRP